MDLIIDAYSTLRTLPELRIPHELTRSNEESQRQHLAIMERARSAFPSGTSASEADILCSVQRAVLQHLARTRHELRITLEETQLPLFSVWAEAANVVFAAPDGRLRDPQGRVLVDENGAADPAARLPYPADAQARKARSEAELRRYGLPVLECLPPVMGEAEARLRSAEEAAWRSLAAYFAFRHALRWPEDMIADAAEVAAALGASPVAGSALTAWEQEFIHCEVQRHHEGEFFIWRIVALETLLWSLGFQEELKFPTDSYECNWIEPFLAAITEEQLLARAALRPASEILDALDLYHRAYAVMPHKYWTRWLNYGEPVAQRYHALYWLTRENADWDDIWSSLDWRLAPGGAPD